MGAIAARQEMGNDRHALLQVACGHSLAMLQGSFALAAGQEMGWHCVLQASSRQRRAMWRWGVSGERTQGP